MLSLIVYCHQYLFNLLFFYSLISKPIVYINFFSIAAALPWTPKVRPKDIDQFLDTTRIKFVGFMLPNDRVSLAGLPLPIHEGVRVLKEVESRSAIFLNI